MSLHCKHEDRKLQVYNDQGVETNTASLPWSTHTHPGGRASEPWLHQDIISLIYFCHFSGEAFASPDSSQGKSCSSGFQFEGFIQVAVCFCNSVMSNGKKLIRDVNKAGCESEHSSGLLGWNQSVLHICAFQELIAGSFHLFWAEVEGTRVWSTVETSRCLT